MIIKLVAAKSAERSSRSKYHSNYPHRNECGPAPPSYEVALVPVGSYSKQFNAAEHDYHLISADL